MEGHLYEVNCDCFPRYQYSLKRKQDILFRYKDLLRALELEKVTENKNKEGAVVYICICKSSENDEFPSIIENIVLRNAASVVDLGIKDLKAYEEKRQFQRQLVFFVVTEKTSCDMLAKSFDGYIIRIANDRKEAQYIKKETHNKVEQCVEEDVGQTICNILERNALNTLRFICESLDKRTSGLQATDSIYKRSSSELDMKKKTKRPGSLDEVPKKSTFPEWSRLTKCSSFDRASESNKGLIRSGGVLNVAAFSESYINERENIERLIAEIVGVFNRSNIPKSQHPVLKKHLQAYSSIPDELLQKLKKISPKIRNCGFRFGTLQIYVEDIEEMEDKIYSEIETSLANHKFTRFSIVSSQVNEFRECRAGSNVSIKDASGEWHYGTLGGVAQTSSEESCRKWALMSRHVAKFSIDGKAHISENESDPVITTIMKEIKEEQRKKEYLDIAVSEIAKDDDKYINERYITEQKKAVPGKLCEYEKDQLYGLPVHIRGAKTKIGLGTITVPERTAIQDNDLGENYIVVENRNKNTPFCKEGDSGAMVCTDSPDNYGEEVHLVSMVIGKNCGQEGSYTTVKLDKGLEELHDLTGKKFSMC